MDTDLPPFPNLRNAMLNLEKCLNCTYCYRVFTDPYTLTTCGHTFCKHCITLFVSAQKANCPLCDLPNWLNQSQPNRQLKALLQNYEKLRHLLAIPAPNTPTPTCIQPRIEKKRKRKKIDLFNISTTKTIEEKDSNGIQKTPSRVMSPIKEIIPENTEEINCTGSVVQNGENIHSPELETRSLTSGLEACIEQTDNDKLLDIDIAIKQTNNLEENITLESADTLPPLTIEHPLSTVLSQEIDLNGLNLTQANSQEISLNQNLLSKSDNVRIDNRLASLQNTSQSYLIGKFGSPIPFQISQFNSPFIQQSYFSPNLNTQFDKQLSSQQQAFPSPIAEQRDVSPSCHTPNNIDTHNVIQTNTPNSSNKQHCSILCSAPNEFENNIFPDPNTLISTPERLNNSPTADHTGEEFATSPIHNSIQLVVPEEHENLTTAQPVDIDHTDNSDSQSLDLLSGFSLQRPELMQPPVVESVENITELPNEYHSIPNSPIIAALQSDSQKNFLLGSPVEESGNISNSPAHTQSNKQDQFNTSQSPILAISDEGRKLDNGLHSQTETHSPLRTNLLYSEDQLSPVIEPSEDVRNNISLETTTPFSHTSPVIEKPCNSPPTTQSPTPIPTPEYQQAANNTAEMSILIEENSMPEKPPVHTGQIKQPFPTDILTIVIPDDSPVKIREVKNDPDRPKQLYPKIIDSNFSSKFNVHETPLSTGHTQSMGEFFSHFHHSQPSSKPQFNYPATRTNLAVLTRSTKFQKFDTFNATQFKHFPQTLPLNSHPTLLKASPNQNLKDCDYFLNFIRNQTQEEQKQKLDIRECSNDNQNPFHEDIPSVNAGFQLLPTPPNTNKQDIIFQTDNTPNDDANSPKETLMSTENKIDNTHVNNNILLPGEDDDVEILLTPDSVPYFDSPIVTEQRTCVVEDSMTNCECNGDECEHIDSQPADSVDRAQTKTPVITTPDEISSLIHIESKVPENGCVSELNDGDNTPTNHLIKSQSNISIPSSISSPPHNETNTIDVDSRTAMLVSPNNTELSPQLNTPTLQLPFPYNSEKFKVFDIKDSPANPLLPSPKQQTIIASPTNLSRFATLQSHTPNRKYENSQPQNTPPPCSQFSQMNEVLSLARDLENRFSKNETIDSDTDSIFSLTQNSPKSISNNFLSPLGLTPRTRTFPTPPSVAKELARGMEIFNSPLGVSIFDYADMGVDENIDIIPHFSPSIGSPPTLNPVKRRANTFQSKKPKLENYKHSEQQASRILSPKKGNEISNFSNRPFRNRGKSRYKHRPFQAN